MQAMQRNGGTKTARGERRQMKDARMTEGRKEDDEEASLTRELPHFRRSEEKICTVIVSYFLQFLSLDVNQLLTPHSHLLISPH